MHFSQQLLFMLSFQMSLNQEESNHYIICKHDGHNTNCAHKDRDSLHSIKPEEKADTNGSCTSHPQIREEIKNCNHQQVDQKLSGMVIHPVLKEADQDG